MILAGKANPHQHTHLVIVNEDMYKPRYKYFADRFTCLLHEDYVSMNLHIFLILHIIPILQSSHPITNNNIISIHPPNILVFVTPFKSINTETVCSSYWLWLPAHTNLNGAQPLGWHSRNIRVLSRQDHARTYHRRHTNIILTQVLHTPFNASLITDDELNTLKAV